MTDKERLEEIKNRTKYVTYREMGTDSVVHVEIVIEESDFKWLINRVEELENNRKKDTIKAMFEGMMKSDPTRQEETFSMFCEVLREWREKQ